MNKVHDTRSGDPAEEAAFWFGRSQGGLGDHEAMAFVAWLEASDANRISYERVARAWDHLGAMASDAGIEAMRSEALRMAPRRRFSLAYVSVVATVLLSLIGVGLYAPEMIERGVKTRFASAEEVTLQTAIGERSTLRLSDGSVVTLNTNSKVIIAMAEHSRSVTLLFGQAFFQVAKDKSRPFVVTAGDREVVAVGTEFDVDLQSGGLRVALLEGKVKVAKVSLAARRENTAPPAVLESGQTLFADSASGRVAVETSDVSRLLSWRQGRIRFEETPLAEAVADMNRYTKTKIRILDPHIENIKISGAFRVGESSSFVSSITAVFPVRAVDGPLGVELHDARQK